MIERRFSLGLAAAFVFAGLGFSSTAVAEEAVKGSAEAGATKAAVCTACHGVNGNSSNPEWPNLAGQNAAYIREQLAMFKARKRINEIMYPDHRAADRAGFRRSRRLLRGADSRGTRGRSFLLEGRRSAVQVRRPGAKHSRVHGVPRPRGPGQCRRGISGAARTAFRVHREAVAGLPHEEPLP